MIPLFCRQNYLFCPCLLEQLIKFKFVSVIQTVKFKNDTVLQNGQKSKGVIKLSESKGPMKLMQWVKIAYSFLQPMSNLFHFIILSLPM